MIVERSMQVASLNQQYFLNNLCERFIHTLHKVHVYVCVYLRNELKFQMFGKMLPNFYTSKQKFQVSYIIPTTLYTARLMEVCSEVEMNYFVDHELL